VVEGAAGAVALDLTTDFVGFEHFIGTQATAGVTLTVNASLQSAAFGAHDDTLLLNREEDDFTFSEFSPATLGDGNDTAEFGFLVYADGGAGSDWVQYAGSDDVTLDLGDPFASLLFSYSSFENADFSAATGAYVIDADLFGSTILGGSGNDTLRGSQFQDSIAGGGGDDSIRGGSGNDTLSGGAGNDFLWGFAGDDALTGGAGDDQFLLDGAPGVYVDVITDFEGGGVLGGDFLELPADVFFGIASDGFTLQAGQFALGTAATDADDYIIYDQATGNLYYDENGDGAGGQLLFAVLSNQAALAAGDILVT
jgi:Ca2+-binding RTX toxin-like protein